jgi:pimeloyl-ACP methyl ester carboxylesterase
MPHAQLQVFDAGHLPHHETPDAVNHAIVAFLASSRNSEKTE